MDVINIGLFGAGVVGSGVVEILRRNRELISSRVGAELRITKIVTRDPKKQRAVALDGIQVSSDPDFILKDPSIQIVAELMGGTDLARTVVLRAVEAGKAVVTANKALLAECAKDVFPAVYKKGVPFGMEASVAGGIPVLRALREGLAGDRILEICGIVNGTCNYILTKMSSEGAAFAAVLAEAQKLGYAEADPTFDVDGHDAAHKLAVLVNLAYGAMVKFDDIYREGIRKLTPMDITFARQLGFRIKLLAIGKLENGKVEARVHPTLVEDTHLLSSVNGVFNAVFLTGDNVGSTLFYGRGAGAAPTGSAVVSDLIEISRTLLQGGTSRIPPLTVMQSHLRELPVLPIAEVHSEYYLRFQVFDRPGVLARMTTEMGQRNISIRSMIQPDQALHPNDPVQVILTTHRAREADVRASLATIEKMDFINGPTQLIRIERFAN